MTALAQASAGLALVMGFALLCIRQVSAASIVLALQCAAVALSAVLLHRPLMAIPPMVLIAGIWFAESRAPLLEPATAPVGGAKLGIAVGAVLTVLCLSLGSLGLPLAIVLLSVVLAATRPSSLMQVMALVGIQNGVVLTASLVGPPDFLPTPLLPFACLLLPLPLAARLLIPRLMTPAVTRRNVFGPAWNGWIDLTLALLILAATLIVPLEPLGTLFAPLLGLDGVLRSYGRLRRPALPPVNRGLVLLNSLFLVLAVCAPNLMAAWLAVLAALVATLLPTPRRRWNDAVLAYLGAGIALLGLLLVSAQAASIPGYFCLFAGLASVVAVVPDLAVVTVILILRLGNQGAWPAAASLLGVAIALAGLSSCALLLVRGRHRTTLLALSQACIAAVSICQGTADGRFSGLVLLVLLILTRSAARVPDQTVATLAIAGLAGIPPLGLFPGLILVVMAISENAAWLLLPLGAAMVPILAASLPHRTPKAWSMRSIGWLPLGLAILAGYAAPDGVAQWWHLLTAGRP